MVTRGPSHDSLPFLGHRLRDAAATTESDPGVPIYIDPIGVQEVNQPMSAIVPTNGHGRGTIKGRLSMAFQSLGLAYVIRDGIVWVESRQSIVESRLSQVEEKLDRILELLEKVRR